MDDQLERVHRLYGAAHDAAKHWQRINRVLIALVLGIAIGALTLADDSTLRWYVPPVAAIMTLIAAIASYHADACRSYGERCRRLVVQPFALGTEIRKRPMTPLPSPGRRFSAARGICRRSIPG